VSDLPDPHSTNAQPDIEKAANHSQQLADKILLGRTSKRSDEEWEHFKERTIQMFRDKGLFDHCNQQPNGKPDA
jgi:hypothetical protein